MPPSCDPLCGSMLHTLPKAPGCDLEIIVSLCLIQLLTQTSMRMDCENMDEDAKLSEVKDIVRETKTKYPAFHVVHSLPPMLH